MALHFAHNCASAMLTDNQNSFTVLLNRKFIIKRWPIISSHLERVATPYCKIFIS